MMLWKSSISLWLLVVACGGGQGPPQAEHRVMLMQPGEGPGERADQIATEMLPSDQGGQGPKMISADLMASIELPAGASSSCSQTLSYKGGIVGV